MCFSCIFVCFARVVFCSFFSSFWCRGWLRFAIVAILGVFYYRFWISKSMFSSDSNHSIALYCL